MKKTMLVCGIAEIVTPKKVLLNGLWFGSKRPKTMIVWVHGLGRSLFSKLDIVQKLVDNDTAVITFNNRGHDNVSRFARVKEPMSGQIRFGGSAHEVFSDCVDDIQGAINFVHRQGIKNVYLAGHSTGCQKSVYWANRKAGRGVKGIILLAPISDYSAEMHLKGKKIIARAVSVAQELVKSDRKHQLLPSGFWHDHIDAQRFLSLYTPNSTEEIFTYAQPRKTPRTFRSVKIPILAIFAENDEYADRSAKEMAAWFQKNARARTFNTVIVKKSTHGFHGKDIEVASAMKKWMKAR